MGAEALLTEEVRNRIAEADYVFGAKRMVESIKKLCKQNVKTYNCYLSKDIIPLIENIQENSAKIVIVLRIKNFARLKLRLKNASKIAAGICEKITPSKSK